MLLFVTDAMHAQAALADSATNYLNTPPTFAGISWGTNTEDVKKAMLAKGYDFDSEQSAKDSDHDLYFKGTVQGVDSEIIELFDSQNHLVRTLVEILTSDDACKKTYEIVRDGMISKYGTPTIQKEEFGNPYSNSDSDFVPAVKANKATLATGWWAPGNMSYGIDVEVESNLTVYVYYDSEAWQAENNRRNAKPDPNL